MRPFISAALRALIVTMAAPLLWLCLAQAAFAHASLTATEPADGAVLAGAPSRFALIFSEPVAPLVLELVAPSGERRALEGARLRDRTLEITAPAGLSDGTHVLSWRVVSEDGHPVGGAVVFSIGAPSAAKPIVAAEGDPTVMAALWASKVALYCGLLLGCGGVFAARWLTQSSDGRRFVVICLMLGIAGAVSGVGFQGLDALGQHMVRLADVRTWGAGLSTSFGRTAIYGLASIAVALLAWITSGAIARTLSIVALLGAGVALSASGHAGSAKPEWLMRPTIFTHAVAVGFWIGSLVPLGLSLRRGRVEAREALSRFSRTIPFALAGLVLAGGVLAIVQVENVSAMVETDYGNVLAVKLGLFATLLGLAIVNRYRLTAMVSAGDRLATRVLVRSIVAETAIVIAILASVAAWRFTPPPRALAAGDARSAHIHLHGETAAADVVFRPARRGPVVVDITVLDGGLGALDAKDVTLFMANEAAGIAMIRRRAREGEGAVWIVEDLVLPLAGRWNVRIDVLISDFEMARLSGEVEIDG